jgi:hypothetical protein
MRNEIKMASPKFAVLSIAAYFEYCDKSFKTREELMNEFQKMWGRVLDETQMSEIVEMGLLEESDNGRGETSEPAPKDKEKYGGKAAKLVLTEKGKQVIASSPNLFQAPLYHHYIRRNESQKIKGETKVGALDDIFSDLIASAGEQKSKGVDKNNNLIQLSHRPPFAFIITGSINAGVLSKIDALDAAIDMLRNRSMQEVILIYEDDIAGTNLKDLLVPGLRILSKKEAVEMIEKNDEA